MATLEIYQVALFEEQPEIGTINPPGEVTYKGYARQETLFMNGTSIEPVGFPTPEIEELETIKVACAVVLNLEGKVMQIVPIQDM